MPVGQAFVVAFGLAFAVLGFLYITWRSTGRDWTASVLRSLLTAIVASVFVGTGTFFVFVREPNFLIAVGVAVYAYASAFKRGFMGWRHAGQALSVANMTRMSRVYAAANLVAATLCGIGCLTYGGAIGVLGVFVSLYWIVLHLWMLNRVTRRWTEGRATSS